MKKILSKAAAAIMVGSIAFSSITVQAQSAYSPREAARDFQQTLELINEIYLYTDEVDYQKVLDAALKAAFDQLDPYSTYLTEDDMKIYEEYTSNHRSGIGIVVQTHDDGTVEVLKVYPQSPAESAGVRAGDVLVSANDVTLSGKSATELGEHLTGDSGTMLRLTISRGGEPVYVTVTRGDYYLPTVERENISTMILGADDSKVAYVYIEKFDVNPDNKIGDTQREFQEIYNALAAEGVQSIILDLRGNPGGDVQPTLEIAKMLTKAGPIFTIVDNHDVAITYESTKDTPFKIAVLVDDSTASAAEILASAIKESGAGIIVGDTTYGKGVGQTILDAPDGRGVIRITFSEVITRNGNRLNGVGVSPDIYVETPKLLPYERTIDQSATGEEIMVLKKLLAYLGYLPEPTDSQYTEAVANAIKKLQADADIEQNGVCTPELQYLINVMAATKYMEKDIALHAAYDALTK